MEVARKYGMLQETASKTDTVRAVFIIDPEGRVRAILYYPLTNGRNIDEILRLVHALQVTDANKVATPANWLPGDDVILPVPVTAKDATVRFDNQGNDYYCLDWYLCMKHLSDQPKSLGIDSPERQRMFQQLPSREKMQDRIKPERSPQVATMTPAMQPGEEEPRLINPHINIYDMALYENESDKQPAPTTPNEASQPLQNRTTERIHSTNKPMTQDSSQSSEPVFAYNPPAASGTHGPYHMAPSPDNAAFLYSAPPRIHQPFMHTATPFGSPGQMTPNVITSGGRVVPTCNDPSRFASFPQPPVEASHKIGIRF